MYPDRITELSTVALLSSLTAVTTVCWTAVFTLFLYCSVYIHM